MTGKQWLLAVGVDEYGAQLRLPNLHCAVHDACSVYELLTTEYDFEAELLARTRDIEARGFSHLAAHSEGSGSRAEVIQRINHLRRRMAAEDLFVFYYAGHGSRKPPGYLLPFDAKWDKVSTYLMYRNLHGELSALRCRFQVLIFDCCYAAGSIAGYVPATSRWRSGDGRVVAFAASDSDQVTPDRIPGVNGGRSSPFSSTLRRFLTEEVAAGESFPPERLAEYLREKVPPLIPPDSFSEPVEPQFDGEVTAVRPGRQSFYVRRPGLRVEVRLADSQTVDPLKDVGHGAFSCRAGAELRFDLVAHRRASQEGDLTVDVQRIPQHAATPPAPEDSELQSGPPLVAPVDVGWSEPAGTAGQGRTCEIRFHFAGTYAFEASVVDGADGSRATRTFEVTVHPAVIGPPIISTAPLPVCHRGEAYEARISIEGGMPPFEALQMEGMPEGFRHDIESDPSTQPPAIRITGAIADDQQAGTAGSSDRRPIIHPVRLSVGDALGHRCSSSHRLLSISKADYCRIPEGEFEVGYRETGETREAIWKMLEVSIARLTRLGPAVPQSILEGLRSAAHQMTQQTVQQALQVNPGSSVWLDDFYIKKYPVTNAQWREFVEVHGGLFLPQHWGDARQYFPSEEASLPVVGISYDHICRYLAWRGTRLPTAWEWERGARGTDGRLFPWGNEFEPSFCNVLDSNTGRLLPVDHFDRHYASPTGVRDMVGNAAEWVERRVFTQATHGHAFAQPFRGGSFLDPCLYALTFRDSAEAGVLFGAGEDDRVVGDTALRWLGFRDVIDLDPEPKAAQELLQVPETVLGIHGQQRKVPSFRMARYPVSNMEYYEFIQATGHPQPADWENDRRFAESLPFPAAKRHLPVVHVGYRDALAFCLWKSRQTGELVRLPTADEWQAAVDGGEGRRYPWGNDFDPQKCNSLTSGWGQRVPVFALRDGRSLQGIFHLVGNIREWVAPTELRGGSWRVDCQRLIEARVRETVRPRDWSRFRANDLGFRYVVQLTGA